MKRMIESVLHPTDFSEGSKVAFHHALKVAVVAKSGLSLLNVSSERDSKWADFPGVRETLEHWGLLPEGSPRSAVAELGMDVSKTIAKDRNPVNAVVNYLDEHPAGLIVLATHQRRGVERWLSSSVAEPIARQAGEMTLFISGNTPGFVSADDGAVLLRNILVPVALDPEAQPALDAAAGLVKSLGCEQGTFTLLHVGSSDSMPATRPPSVPGWEWKKDIRSGDVIQTIVEASEDTRADLIVMTTAGPHGFLDGLRGSHSERVLRLAGMPLLTVPVGSFAYDGFG